MIWYESGHGDVTTYVHNSKGTTVKINVFNVEQLNQSSITKLHSKSIISMLKL